MRNQDRIPVPYTLANSTNGNISIAGIPLGQTTDTEEGSTVVIRTNGGLLITMPAYNVETSPPAQNNG